jgi:hypothetical protein
MAGRASATGTAMAASGGRSERSRTVWRRTGAARGGIAVEPEIADDETTLRGYLLAFTADGFEMIAEGSVYAVVVTDETELEGFNDLSELSLGDEVEARGLLQGATLIASRVKLRSSGEEARLRGSSCPSRRTGSSWTPRGRCSRWSSPPRPSSTTSDRSTSSRWATRWRRAAPWLAWC